MLPDLSGIDASWNVLLCLYIAEQQGTKMPVSSACQESGVAPTTALRHIHDLTDAGYIDRQGDPNDRRRSYLALTAKGREVTIGLLAIPP